MCDQGEAPLTHPMGEGGYVQTQVKLAENPLNTQRDALHNWHTFLQLSTISATCHCTDNAPFCTSTHSYGMHFLNTLAYGGVTIVRGGWTDS